MKIIKLLIFFVLTLLSVRSFAQTTHTIKGRITDATSGDPVPFANIGIKNTPAGTTTNFDGFYTLTFTPPADSILVTYIGYATKSKAIADTTLQTIDVQLTPGALQLREVKIFAGENPAWAIMRKIVANRKKNNTENLDAYEYESYNKIQIDIDNLSEKFRNRRAVKKMTHIVDKYDEVKGDDGQTIIPIFISESVSNVYFRRDPKKKKEIINKTKVSGVGLTDGSFVSQIVGSSFQQYNFYNNWLNVLEKDFISPISDSWKLYYDYYLADSISNGTNYDYQIDFEPRQEQDLAFSGSFWIDGKTYALTQMDANVGKKANLNFIERIKIQTSYDLFEDDSTTWVPTKTRVLIDVDEPTKQTAGLLLKFYSSNSNYKLNVAKGPKFFDTAIELKEDYMVHDSTFWAKSRPESLSKSELLSFQLVDSLKVLPVVKTYTEILNIFVNGYKKIDKWNIDIGPYLFLYANNNIEGNRLRMGFKTDPGFSREWIVSGYGAYGFKDQKFKYGGGVDYIFSRKPWTMAGISYSKDLERLGLSAETIGTNTLFGAFSRFGTFRRAYFQEDVSMYFRREIVKGFTANIQLRHRNFNPLFDFAYRSQPQLGADSPLKSKYEITELNVETRLAGNETFLQNDNERISMGTGNSPAFTFRYTMGIKNFLSGDFNYQKFAVNVKQTFRAGVFGRTYYNLTLGYIPSTIPYTLLYTPLGNESLFYVDNAFNLMKYFEFISDRYLTLRVEHNDEGFILNRIPAVRKLKWRLLATGRVFYGQVSKKNLALASSVDAEGNPIQTFNELGNAPYLELGYGIDNIFKFGRIDAIHRLTYKNNPNVTPFALKISFWFSL